MTTLLIIWNVLLTAGVLLLWNRYLKQHEKIVNLKYDLKKTNEDSKGALDLAKLAKTSSEYAKDTVEELKANRSKDNIKHDQMYVKIFDQLNKKMPRRPMTDKDLGFEMKEDEPDDIKPRNVTPILSPMGPMISTRLIKDETIKNDPLTNRYLYTLIPYDKESYKGTNPGIAVEDGPVKEAAK